MTKYNSEYYVALKPFGDGQLFVKADPLTSSRNYYFERPLPSSGPFTFFNARKLEDKAAGIVRDIPANITDGLNLIISEEMRNEINRYPILDMVTHPVIYIDDEGNHLEKYWFMVFFKSLDCWDRNRSDVMDVDDDEDDEEFEFPSSVNKFSLDEKVLDVIPEENRLVFQIGGNVTKSYIFVHEKIVKFYNQSNQNGVRFIKVSDFEEGMQFRK